jgi:hypothetical protein
MMPTRGLALRSTLIIIGLSAALVAALYYFFIDPYSSRLLQFRFNDMLSAASMPEDIVHATYLLTPANGGGVYRGGSLSYDEYERNGSFVVDVAYVADREVELAFVPSSRLYVVMVDGESVYSSKSQLLHLFASADASRVAVAKRDSEAFFETETSAWSVVVIDAATGATWEVGGFGAVFLDADTVLAFRSDGIAAVDYETGVEQMAKELPTSLVYPSITHSADGSKIAFTTLEKGLYVYDVINGDEVALALLKELTIEEVRSRVALTDENVYEIVLHEDGRTDLVRHAIFSEDAARVRSLPSSLSTTKLIP